MGEPAEKLEESKGDVVPSVAHWGSYDLRGAHVGELVVTEPVAREEGRGVVWETICPCGAIQFRTTGQLTYARDTGRKPLCPKCLAEWRETSGYERRDSRVEHFYWMINRINPEVLASPEKTRSLLRTVLDSYGLYGSHYDEREEEALRTEIYKALGAPSDIIDGIAEAEGPWEGNDPGGLDWSVLYPLAADSEHALYCSDCKTDQPRGWGCTRCIEFSCFRCVTEGQHRCQVPTDTDLGPLEDGATFDVVGAHSGKTPVSRERVRQITGRAIRRLRETLIFLEGAAETKCREARSAIFNKLPQCAYEEALWAAEEERKTKAVEERQQRAREVLAWERKRTQEALIAEAQTVVTNLLWAVRRKIAVAQLNGDVTRLPWELRYSPSGMQFVLGDSIATAKSLDGFVSCCSCRTIVVYGTTEFAAHAERCGKERPR